MKIQSKISSKVLVNFRDNRKIVEHLSLVSRKLFSSNGYEMIGSGSSTRSKIDEKNQTICTLGASQELKNSVVFVGSPGEYSLGFKAKEIVPKFQNCDFILLDGCDISWVSYCSLLGNNSFDNCRFHRLKSRALIGQFHDYMNENETIYQSGFCSGNGPIILMAEMGIIHKLKAIHAMDFCWIDPHPSEVCPLKIDIRLPDNIVTTRAYLLGYLYLRKFFKVNEIKVKWSSPLNRFDDELLEQAFFVPDITVPDFRDRNLNP